MSYRGEKIKARLCEKASDVSLFILDMTDSTNTYSKTLIQSSSVKGVTAVIADGQYGGRGTRGRSFISERGRGLYMSILFFPKENISPSDITVYAAVKICESIESLCTLDAKIKWVNDIYVSGKKLGGILTEGKISDNKLEYAIMGVGINTHGYTLPNEISSIATTVESECGAKIDREELAAEIINRFVNGICEIGNAKIMDEYKRRSMLIGKRVAVVSGTESFNGTVMEILGTGSLSVKDENGNIRELQSADVSLKIT